MSNGLANNKPTAISSREAEGMGQRDLTLDQKGLEDVPMKLSESSAYRTLLSLDLSGNEISELPPKMFANLPLLESLVIQNNKLIAIPKEVCLLKKLKSLKLDHNLLCTLPQSIGELPMLELLSLGKNSLLTLPMAISGLSKTLTFLNLSNNCVKFIPPEIGDLAALLDLYMDHNRFCSIPVSIIKCLQLRELSMDWLCYTSFAVSHVKGETLQKVMSAFKKIAESQRRAEIDAMEAITSMSDEPFDVNAQDMSTNRTWLHMASRHNHISVIQALLQHGAEIDALDKERYSPLCLAIKHHSLDSAGILLEAGADIRIGGGPFGTPMHMAVIKCELWLVKELLRRGASSNASDEECLNTPLHQLFASFDRSPHKAATIAEVLLLASANPNLKNIEGWAPIHIAAKKGQSKAIKWILQNNAWIKEKTGACFDINLTGGAEKWTALHLAGHAGHYKLVQMFISSGADLFVRNADFRTPRQASKGNLAIYKLFKRAELRVTLSRLGVNDQGLMVEQQDDSDARTAKSVNSPVRSASVACIQHVEVAFTTEAARKVEASPRHFGPAKEGMSRRTSLLPFEPASSILNREHDLARGPQLDDSAKVPYSTCRGPYGKTINAYYLRDKVLNNAARLHERYDALNTLKGNKSGVQTIKVFGEILSKVLSVSNQGLQLDVIHSADVIIFPGNIQALETLLHECSNQTLRHEIESALESVKVVMVHKMRNETMPSNSNGRLLSSSIKLPKGLLLSMQKERTNKYFNES